MFCLLSRVQCARCNYGLALTTFSSNRPRTEITFGSVDFVLVIPSFRCQRRQEEVLFLSRSSARPSLLPLINLKFRGGIRNFLRDSDTPGYRSLYRRSAKHSNCVRRFGKKKSRRQGPVKIKLSSTSSNSLLFFPWLERLSKIFGQN